MRKTGCRAWTSYNTLEEEGLSGHGQAATSDNNRGACRRQKFQPPPKISRFVHPKDVEVPLKAFCTTKEDFHREYGLSLEGKDVRKLIDADVPISDWMKVFTCFPVKEKKVPIKTASRFVHPKDVEVPLKAFCTTKDDFHREYGLSLEGKDVRKLIDANVPISDWMKAFTCFPMKEKKVPIKTTRLDHYKALYQLYKQVYQSKPPNYPLGVKFARGYVYFVCTGPIKWTEFVFEVVKNVTNEGHLDRKREQWKLETSQVSTGTPSGSVIFLVNTPFGSTPAESGLFVTTQSVFSVEVSTSLQELLVEVKKSHDNVSTECQKAKDSVVKSVVDVHHCKGALDTI
ncbi:hypothetical protein L7F22_015553 [Adiantum nelumboides]|nr:hypothetical protein [Adiantum nelumboides]